ncbi:MAG TPA: hypothetical protein VLN57_21030 [Xanthobacteraceae bacterium]|nr:hypothetical protein [Xanthobacteraceae bacterium]
MTPALMIYGAITIIAFVVLFIDIGPGHLGSALFIAVAWGPVMLAMAISWLIDAAQQRDHDKLSSEQPHDRDPPT